MAAASGIRPTRQVPSGRPEPRAHDSAEMERQHEQLLLLVRDIAAGARSGASKRELSELLDDLARFTRQHFGAEEEYMVATEYARADVHRLIHQRLLSRLHEHIYAFQTGSGKLSHELLSFLEFWLAAHLHTVDEHFERHVASRAVGPAGAVASHEPPSGVRDGEDASARARGATALHAR